MRFRFRLTNRIEPVEAAGLLLTDWCPASCRHCYVSSGPGGRSWMSVEDATAHWSALARLGVAASKVHVSGGEPFGDFDRLVAVVSSARRAGLEGVGYVETSGFWATDEPTVRDRLSALRHAGMQQIAISADPYHQEFVPPDRVRLLYETAVAVLGPGSVRARRWQWLKQPRDLAALPETAKVACFRAAIVRHPERFAGRAARRLAPLAARGPIETIPEAPCRAPLLAGRHVHITPAGWIMPGTCAGLSLGRANINRPLDRVLAAWRPRSVPVASLLLRGGARALAAGAAASGFVPDPKGYADGCHLCWAVRSCLLRAGTWDELLRPVSFYDEGGPGGADRPS